MLLLHICGWNMVCELQICIIGNKSSTIASENDRELAKDRPYVGKEEDHIKIKNIAAVWHNEGLPHTVIGPSTCEQNITSNYKSPEISPSLV